MHRLIAHGSISLFPLSIPTVLLSLGLSVFSAKAQNQIYRPIPLPDSNEITDTLSALDIPTGTGGYAPRLHHPA